MNDFSKESLDSQNKPDKNRGLRPTQSLKSKLLRTYLSIALVGMATLLMILGYLIWDQSTGEKEQYFNVPRARGATQTLVGIHRSLSALRAWVLLGDPVFKVERRSAWKNEIYPALQELQDLALRWGDAEDVVRFQEIEILLKNLEYEQWWIEDVAQTPGNEPARVLFTGQAKVLAQQILPAITSMINIEKLLPAGEERKKILGQMSDLRAYFVQSHTDISLFVSSGSNDDEHQYRQHIEIAYKMRRQIKEIETILDERERKLFLELGLNLNAYTEITRHVIDLRRSDQWNLARAWLDQKAIPLVNLIDRTFREMSRDQFELIRQEVEHDDQVEVRLIIMTLLSLLILGFTASILSNKHANQIIRPINVLSQAAGKISEAGELSLIPPGENDEIGGLIASFNRMQQRLKKKSEEARNRFEEVELKNQMMIRTKRAMTGIMGELKESKINLEHSLQKLDAERTTLKKTNLELDSFVYTASHDLRAPLRGISSFSKFLEEDYADLLDDEGKDYLRRIRSGVRRMTQLIDDLLLLSRISRQKNPYEEVQVAEMIRSVTNRIEYDLEECQVELVIQKEMPVIRCDRIKVSEVFLNLINNAIKFSHKNKDALPKIEIGYKPLDGLHQFFVKDNGIGIDPKYHEKVFDIFQRLHTREEYEGTGAGLSIVKRVIDDHEGRLWIDSELGKGATFNFTIPNNLGANNLGEGGSNDQDA